MGRFVFIYVTPREDYFLYDHDNTHAQTQQTNSIFWEVILDTFFRKRNRRGNKVAKYWIKTTFYFDKQNDDLIIRLENFKALMEFKAKYFDGDKNTQ